MNTSFIPYDIRSKQWNMERKIKKQLFDPDFDFFKYVCKSNVTRSYDCIISV